MEDAFARSVSEVGTLLLLVASLCIASLSLFALLNKK
jgi:hypothetical protein